MISFKRCFIYHFGSIVLGGLLLGLISIFRSFFEYLYVKNIYNYLIREMQNIWEILMVVNFVLNVVHVVFGVLKDFYNF